MKTCWQKQSVIILLLLYSIVGVACTITPATSLPQPTVTPASAAQSATDMQPAIPTATPVSEASTPAFDPIVSTTFIAWENEGPLVEGSESTLVRMEHGLYMTFKTAELASGEPMTIWWAIFNKPENCSDDECGIDDVFLVDEQGNRLKGEDGAARPNLPGRAATEFSLLRATGTVIDVDGRAEFRGHLPIGDIEEVYFGDGLTNLLGSEVHLIVRTHGPPIPGRLHEQLNTDWGGCPKGWPKDPCGDLQIAIHKAPDQPPNQETSAMANEMATEAERLAQTTFMEWVGTEMMVEGAESTLVRMPHGLYTTVKAVDLSPGEAMTLWWVVFNKPENCSNVACGIGDAFLIDQQDKQRFAEDGAPLLNLPGRAVTEFSLLRATGSIVDVDGRAEFRAHLPLGDTEEVYFGPGLLNPMAAEIHVVVRTHSEAIPGQLHQQLNTDWGGCPEGWPKDPCRNVQVAIHKAQH